MFRVLQTLTQKRFSPTQTGADHLEGHSENVAQRQLLMLLNKGYSKGKINVRLSIHNGKKIHFIEQTELFSVLL